MNVRIIPMLLLCCVVSLARAEDIQLQDNHPDRYVVVKGDTLWAIAGRFLKDPWRWPQIWKMNREQIKNPHWIYPGNVIVLDTSSGSPELRLLRETVTLQPEAREEALAKEAIPTISPSIIAPFLTQPLVVDESGMKDAPAIVSGEEGRLLLGAGHKAYVDRIDEDSGLNWQIYQQGAALTDPDTKEVLGHEAIYLGDARVSRFGEPTTIEITRSRQEIHIGDKLVRMPATLMGSFVPHAPDSEITGRVLSIFGGMSEAGRNTIITVNRGKADGLEEGHVLAIDRHGEALPKKTNPREHIPEVNLETSHDSEGKLIVNLAKEHGQIKLPDERVGLIMVFRTFERVSYALVMQSEQPIHLSDIIRTP
ncbi:MAG: LysM peptidoglycan-binding domain-containing protein [Nitrosomonadales bacterium]|nr:MAG: LysM peptidoglycan-binding domain-containing protein [Nitrosomonadales bacterium]